MASELRVELSAIRIFRLRSFSRSGETILLRHLNAHSKVSVVHQILAHDSPNDKKLSNFIKQNELTEMSRESDLLSHRDLNGAEVLVIKNATELENPDLPSIGLVRNALSVSKSAYRHTDLSGEHRRKQNIRWARGIDKDIADSESRFDNLELFLLLWNRKTMHDLLSNSLVFRYEDLVRDTSKAMTEMFHWMGLEMENTILGSHLSYAADELGHGGIKLGEPMHSNSLSNLDSLDRDTIKRILSISSPVLAVCGYHFAHDMKMMSLLEPSHVFPIWTP